MDDRLEAATRRVVGEHQPTQRSTIERAVGQQHGRPEGGDDLGQPGRSRRDRLAGEPIGVDHVGAERSQPLGHHGLPRCDPAGQPHPQHAPDPLRE